MPRHPVPLGFVFRSRAKEVESLAKGDLSVTVTPSSDRDILGLSLAGAIGTLKQLIAEFEGLTRSATGGELSARGRADKFTGHRTRLRTTT